MTSVATLLLCLTMQGPASERTGQPSDAYHDEVARALVERARAGRHELGRSITSYTALVQQRSGVQLRMPLRDRLLASEESAAHVRWSRDGTTVIQQLAGRTQSMAGVSVGSGVNNAFNPAGDRIYFGHSFGGEDDLYIAHPLAEGSEQSYRYRSGDTLTLRLPDGRAVRAVELRVIPRRVAFNYMHASLWIEPETGALVRAIYRPSRNLDLERDSVLVDDDDLRTLRMMPGFVRPYQGEIESVVVDYSLWAPHHWLPRLMRVEGHVRAGVIRMPFATETSYRIEDVEDESNAPENEPDAIAVLAAWGAEDYVLVRERGEARPRAIFQPADKARLLTAPELPPAIWEVAPAFVTQAEIDGLVARLERGIPRIADSVDVELRVLWVYTAPDLVRYNRVEGLSAGVRLQLEHPQAVASATTRLGVADLHPNAHLGATRLGRRHDVAVAGYHELHSVDEGHALRFGNSLNALLFGRDDGEYYRATGARVSLRAAERRRGFYDVALFAERQTPVELGTDWSFAHLFNSQRTFRPVLPADSADLLGATIRLAPWWGHSPARVQAGAELLVEGGVGDFAFARSSLTTRATLPLTRRFRIGVEAGAGTSHGEVPLQYNWFLGGPRTLRGYAGSALIGTSMARGRLELVGGTPVRALSLFGDAAWAGDRAAFDLDHALFSVGLGASLLDGILRIDVARALREPKGWRADIYLDALL